LLLAQSCFQPILSLYSSPLGHPAALSYLKTSIAQSGHTTAQMAQPLHSSLFTTAGKHPLRLDTFEIAMQPLGHATAHKPQPLHRSASILTRPLMSIRPPGGHTAKILAGPGPAARAKGVKRVFRDALLWLQVSP
jgi:hypothetical protein